VSEVSPRLDGLLLSLVAQRYDGDEEEARQAYESALRRVAWRKGRGYKVCSSCQERLSPSEFGVDSTNPDGLRRVCRRCRRRRRH
jgi:hypothetical protein